MGFCRRHCTSQVVDRSHRWVSSRSWPTVGARATIWIGTRCSTAKASKTPLYFGPPTCRESFPTHLEMRASKQRATATSTDAMLRLASAQTTPLWMEPEGHAAVSASAVLRKRYFVPKPPAPPGPPNRAHLAHVHRASRRGRLTERSPTCSLRPRADRRCRWCRREVAGATPRAHLRTRGLVSAGRWSAVGAVERTGHRPPAQAAAGARQRGGAVPPPRRPRMASPRGGGHRPPPAHPPFPPISTCGTGSVTKTIGCSARQQLVEADEARSGVLSKLEVGEHT